MAHEDDELFDENDEPTQRVTLPVLATRLRIVERKVDKLPTSSDVRLLVVLALVANQILPNIGGQTPIGFIAGLLWRAVA